MFILLAGFTEMCGVAGVAARENLAGWQLIALAAIDGRDGSLCRLSNFSWRAVRGTLQAA
jgi:hypothetical protein